MRYEMAADCAADVTRILTENLTSIVSDEPLALYRALHTLGLEVLEEQGRNVASWGERSAATYVTLFCPVEAAAAALGVSRQTIWGWARRLKHLGLVDWKAFKSTLRGATRNAGTVWQLKLNPNWGGAARLRYHDLKRPWRDLDADVLRRRTVFRQVRTALTTIKEPANKSVDLDLMRAWSLSPTTTQKPVTTDGHENARPVLERVFDVSSGPRETRGEKVDLAAQALAMALADRAGTNFYRALLWRLLRRYDATGEDHFRVVFLEAQRAQVDSQDGFARKAGAVFVTRMKRAVWWEEVARADGPVGVRPITA